MTDETLSYEVIKETVYGAGHYLGHAETLPLMKSEFLYPEIADRQTPGAWAEAGHPTIYEHAHKQVHEILSEYYPIYIPAPDADRRSRERFPINLKPEDMKPGNGRWGKA